MPPTSPMRRGVATLSLDNSPRLKAWVTGAGCQCGRGETVAIMLVRLGGPIVLYPLTWTRADSYAADERCVDCVADAARFLRMSPTQAVESMTDRA